MYCYKGYFMLDLQKYCIKEEVFSWMEQDLIEYCLNMIKENKWLFQKEIDEIDVWVKNEVEEVVKFVEEFFYLDVDDLYEDVYQELNYLYIIE